MSMIGNFRQISPSQLANIKDDPSLVEVVLFPDPDHVASEGRGDCKWSEEIDIDKAWHGIHFLLTGSAGETESALGAVIMGGEGVGDDLGYGPARYLTPERVKELARALAEVKPEDLVKNFDPEKMTDQQVYPLIWDEGDEALEYLLHHFHKLKDYYNDAAAKGNGMLLYMT